MNDSQFLIRALELAKQRKGFCAPNPAVGAVITKDSEVLATGFHWGSGHSHAEVEALKQLSFEQSNQADLYVTLEPCCHHGKTPPCTEAIINSGISRVFYGFKDPDSRVAGKGIAQLAAAGIVCEQIELPEINDFYASYQHWQQHKTPRIIAKLALSLDGKIAGANGQSVKITGETADIFTHQQRKLADAILTTVRTVQNDNPQMNVRLGEETLKKPLYVLDSQLVTPLSSQIFQTAEVNLLHSKHIDPYKIAVYQAANVTCIPVLSDDNGLLQWEDIFLQLGNRHIQSLWIEAGARCFESLILGNHLHEAYLYFSSQYIGAHGVSAFSTQEDLFANKTKKEWQLLGEDILCKLYFG